MRNTLFINEKVSVQYVEDKRPYIAFYDLTDHYNGTSGFTRNVRGIKKAAAFVEHLMMVEGLKNDLGFYDVSKLLNNKFKLNTHTYCSVD